MLEQLFGSRTRWKLLKTFLSHPDEHFYIRELTRTTGEKLNSIRRELSNLEEWGIVMVEAHEGEDPDDAAEKKTSTSTKAGSGKQKGAKQMKKFYRVDPSFLLFEELKELIVKSWLMVEKSLVKKILKLGNIHMMLLSGRFVGNDNAETDVLIIGALNKTKLSSLMKSLAKGLGDDINYTVMTKKEFEYRKAVTDKFLYGILEGEHIMVIDKSK